MDGKTFEEVLERFRRIDITESFDMIVAVANGGIVPAGILCRKLSLPVYLLRLNLRDACRNRLYDEPKLLSPVDFEYRGKRILLVEDRIKTGTTIEYAKKLLDGAAVVKTFAVNGNADYALYNGPCFPFPWLL